MKQEVHKASDEKPLGATPRRLGRTPPRPHEAKHERLCIGGLELEGRWLLAPMAGVTDWPFRALARAQGAALSYTEMVSAEGLLRYVPSTLRFLAKGPGESPFAPQIFGSRPESLARAAAIAEDMGADLVDLNMGCPVKKVCRSGAGAALLKSPPTLEAVIRAVVRAVSIPVQVKVRIGWDDSTINVVEVAKRAESAGAAAIAIHGRTRTQGYGGTADWSLIAEAKQAVPNMVVIGNGDIRTAAEALDRLETYELDAVMIGRAACGNPWIFREIEALAGGNPVPPRPSTSEWRETILLHLHNLVTSLEGDTERAVRRLRKHLVWYSQGRRGAVSFRSELARLTDVDDVIALVTSVPNQDEEALGRARGAAIPHDLKSGPCV